MTQHKMRAIIEAIRRRGILPTDEFGNLLPPNEIIIRLGLSELLSVDEQRVLKRELIALTETQAVIDQLEANMP